MSTIATAGTADNATILDKTLLFAGLHATHKEQIFGVLKRQEYPAQQPIFHEGDPGDALYVIRSGKVLVHTKNEQLGVTFELATLGPGQVFGEMALLTEERRSASVKAVEPTVCYVLSVELFKKIIGQLPAVSLGIAQTLARRLIEVNKQQSISFGSLADYAFDPAVYHSLPAGVLLRHKIIPLAQKGNVLTLAMVDPANVMALDDLRRLVRDLEIQPVAISDSDYTRFLRDKVKAPATAATAAAKAQAGDAAQVKIFGQSDGNEEKSVDVQGPEVVAAANQILAEGLERGASDIHLDQESLGVLVRYRIDGQMQQRDKVIPLAFSKPLLARLKVMGGMDPTERHKPQDGRIALSYRDHSYDLRVATMPVRRGERVTLRVLDAAKSLVEVGKLILAPRLAQSVEQLVARPQGLVLVTGPTGSGKTTTLYSLLKARMKRQQNINVVTAEDPVEYSLAGVAQVEIHESTGLTFPAVLRGLLRHDPDVILIGETRDAETARISVQASLTGHLVLTSLHTNSALDSIVRLRDLGLEGYLIASALAGIVAQRLVRRNCPACATPKAPPPAVLSTLMTAGFLKESDTVELKEGAGCEACKGTGFQGRIGVYEVLTLADSTRTLIATNAPLADVKADALTHGLTTLKTYATFLLKNGLTTVAEILRVIEA
ncbi:MAG: Flp pilus assembly complex ATPase component TadA [Deltaproteobacteria bacterium]|nr:Flp pilus assembly complex ATPase component TadA [Deltaproteobacteria bacterium]